MLRLLALCVKQLPRVRCDLSRSAVVDNPVSHVHVRSFFFVVPCLVVAYDDMNTMFHVLTTIDGRSRTSLSASSGAWPF